MMRIVGKFTWIGCINNDCVVDASW